MTIKDWPHNIVNAIADKIISDFPLFDKFFVDYIMPLTDYDKNQFNPNWRNDTYPHLEGIGMACFGIIKSLNFISINTNDCCAGDKDQKFKNIYFHFGLCFDNIENLARQILLSQQKLGLRDLNDMLVESNEKITKDFTKWMLKYDTLIDKHIKEGKPIVYYPPVKTSLLKSIIRDKSIFSAYVTHIDKIKQYRNLFTHNPSVDLFRIGNDSYTISKENKNLNRFWSDMRKYIKDNPKEKVLPSVMINEDFNQTFSILNRIWTFFIEETHIIYTHKDFIKLMNGFNRNKFYAY